MSSRNSGRFHVCVRRFTCEFAFFFVEINRNVISNYGRGSLEFNEFREFTEFGVGGLHLEKSVRNQGNPVFQCSPIGFFLFL